MEKLESEKPITAIEWKPWPAQVPFHQSPAYEGMFGGTKGPGKTDSILREPTRQMSNKNYRAIIFRRTYPRLGEIIDRSFKYYLGMGYVFSGKDQQLGLPAWTSPEGAKIAFGHCQHEKDKYNWQGKEFHFMGFDQIEEFTENQYLFLMAQNRTSDPTIRCYVRSTANPGGVGHGWVKRRFIDCLTPYEIKYFTRIDDEDTEVPESDPRAVSRIFIPANVYDNPSIMQNDPNYVRRLEQLPENDKKALLYGDWDVFKGQFFPMWRKLLHVQIRDVLVEYPKFLALDYGFTAPSAVGWYFVDYDGRIHCYRELYKEGLTYTELAEMIVQMTPAEEVMDYCAADPAIWGDKQRHVGSLKGESGGEMMQQVFDKLKRMDGQSFSRMQKADNNRITGWGRMRIRLQGENGVPWLTYDPLCKAAIRTVPTLVYDELKPEDCNTEGEDHCPDRDRYACMSRPLPIPRKERKPWDDLPLKDAIRADKIHADFEKLTKPQASDPMIDQML